MNETKRREEPTAASTLVEGFHRVKSLVPAEQTLIRITRDTRVADALTLMEQHHFSQLPVMSGSALLGIFSYRSFSTRALARQKSARKEWLGGLPVEEFLEAPQYVPANEDWTNIQRHLDEHDFFFVGHPDQIDGFVATMDVYNYFRGIADPFILIAEIELALRRIIDTCIPHEKQAAVFEHSLAGGYEPGKVPRALSDMTLNDYVQLISTRDHWPYFEQLFGDNDRARSSTVAKLKPVPGWRNDTFHFRRELEAHEMRKLADCRSWLHRCVRAFEGQQREINSKSRQTVAAGNGRLPEDITAASAPSDSARRPVLRQGTESAEPTSRWLEGETYDQRMARIRKDYPRAYESWSEAEEADLRRFVAQGKSKKEIADLLQRQPSAITSRMNKLGI